MRCQPLPYQIREILSRAERDIETYGQPRPHVDPSRTAHDVAMYGEMDLEELRDVCQWWMEDVSVADCSRTQLTYVMLYTAV